MAKPVDVASTLVGRHHPQTSVEAGRRAMVRSGTARRRVLEAIAYAPRTDEEIQEDLGLSPNTARPRRVELVRDGYVRDTGQRRTTGSGSKSIVWSITPDGINALLAALDRT